MLSHFSGAREQMNPRGGRHAHSLLVILDPNDPRYRDAYQPDPDHLPPPGVNSDFNDLRRGNGRGGRGSGSRGGLGGGVGGGGFDNMYM